MLAADCGRRSFRSPQEVLFYYIRVGPVGRRKPRGPANASRSTAVSNLRTGKFVEPTAAYRRGSIRRMRRYADRDECVAWARKMPANLGDRPDCRDFQTRFRSQNGCVAGCEC